MQSEEFDKRVREAAEHHHPAYDEKAWGKMEKLLDKHLPTKENDRKRMIFFLLLFLLLGAGGTWLFFDQPWKKTGKQLAQTQSTVEPAAKTTTGVTELPATTSPSGTLNGANNADNTNNNINGVTSTDDKQDNKREGTNNGPTGTFPAATNKNKKDEFSLTVKDGAINRRKRNNSITQPNAEKKTDANNPVALLDANKTPNGIADLSGKVIADYTSTTPLVKTEPRTNGKEENKKENKPAPVIAQGDPGKKIQKASKRSSAFFFTLSAGPDISAVGTDKLGTIKLLAGVGLGYTFRDRFTLRTGFYTSRKVYSASPDKYHPPSGFWTYYPYMEKIDANCKVYEIPVSMSYNFGRSTRQHWFASTGLSTYLMKKEDYNYFYKQAPTGPTYNYKYSISDENKHFFSVLTLSGGYQRNFGKTFSIMAEPYVKLPLGGVGFGKVKLDGAGVLFTVGIKPFTHSAKKDKISH